MPDVTIRFWSTLLKIHYIFFEAQAMTRKLISVCLATLGLEGRCFYFNGLRKQELD